MVWINALVASAGGQIIENAEAGDDATPSMASPGRRRGRRDRRPAGPLVGRRRPTCPPPARRRPGRSSRATPARSWSTGPTSTPPPRARSTSGALDQAVVDDIGWARYPRVDAGHGRAPRRWAASTWPSATFTEHPDEAARRGQAASPRSRATPQYMVESGNPAARAAAYDDPEVREAFPMADLIRDSINDAGAPADHAVLRRRVDLGAAHLASGRRRSRPPRRPRRPTRYMAEVLRGERLL